MASTVSGSFNTGAWPWPGTVSVRRFGCRSTICSTVSALSKSELAPRMTLALIRQCTNYAVDAALHGGDIPG